MRYNKGMRKSDPKRFGAHMSTKFKTQRDISCAFTFHVVTLTEIWYVHVGQIYHPKKDLLNVRH